MNPSQRLDATFAALADPTRRALLLRLASGEASVAELAEPFEMSQPAISKHLKVLERAGLISRSRAAQRRPRRIDARPLAEAAVWLERYRALWEAAAGDEELPEPPPDPPQPELADPDRPAPLRRRVPPEAR